MIPVLIDFGTIELFGREIPLRVNSFGLMVVLAFAAGAWLVTLELRRRKLEPAHVEGYPMRALIGGLLGAKLYFVVEHLPRFFEDPVGTLFSGAGLTWYGGLIGGAIAVLWTARRHGQPLWSLCDAFGPGLAASYGVGRIGCQLSGDGDYGPPSDLPWAMAYPKGVVPTEVPVHPTPVYEILMMIPIVWLLWRLRRQDREPGWLFGGYLVLVGAERWVAELFRVRLDKALGMSMAQWWSLGAIGLGLWLLYDRRQRRSSAHA
jgi:phosphatidylglycerol:prolipoprotein diacylglycerol transferase